MLPSLPAIALEMEALLAQKMLPFWLERSIDMECGGYLTCIDENGAVSADADKMIVTQTRMLWGFSALREFAAGTTCAEKMAAAAHQGYEFLIKCFWDRERGGFRWMTARDGRLLDAGKLMYAQSFGIYALCAYYLAYGKPEALARSARDQYPAHLERGAREQRSHRRAAYSPLRARCWPRQIHSRCVCSAPRQRGRR